MSGSGGFPRASFLGLLFEDPFFPTYLNCVISMCPLSLGKQGTKVAFEKSFIVLKTKERFCRMLGNLQSSTPIGFVVSSQWSLALTFSVYFKIVLVCKIKMIGFLYYFIHLNLNFSNI